MNVIVIVLCPCCASTVEATATPGQQNFTCCFCDQTWSMVVDARRHADHALN